MYFSLKTWIPQRWMRLIEKWNTSKGRFRYFVVIKEEMIVTVLIFVYFFLQVLPGLCKTNPTESSRELVQFQPQKSSFKRSSITGMGAGKLNATQTLDPKPPT